MAEIYNKIEFSVDPNDCRTREFGRDLREIIDKYRGCLVGFCAKDLTAGKMLCEDANEEESEQCINQVY